MIRTLRLCCHCRGRSGDLTLELGPDCKLGCDGSISANWPSCEKDRPDRRCDPILREIGAVAAPGTNGGWVPPLSRTGSRRSRIYPEVATTWIFAQRNP